MNLAMGLEAPLQGIAIDLVPKQYTARVFTIIAMMDAGTKIIGGLIAAFLYWRPRSGKSSQWVVLHDIKRMFYRQASRKVVTDCYFRLFISLLQF